MDLFAGDVTELELPHPAFSGGRAWFARPFVLLPNVRAVRISAHPMQLAANAGSSSITDVSVTSRGQASPKQVFEKVASLPPRRLEMLCALPDRHQHCPIQNREVTDPETRVTVKCTPHVR